MGTDNSSSNGCDAFGEDLAQLALGTLSGRERAEVIDHLEGCAECAAELEELSVAADTLLVFAPEATPPVGFDERVVAAFAGRKADPRRRVRWVIAVAAAALVALGVGIGALVARPTSHEGVTEATLTSTVGAHGTVELSWGADAWMFMTLSNITASGPVTCTVTLDNGHRETVGHFRVHAGYGAWAVWLRAPVSAIRSVAVLDRAGVTLASATV